MVMRGEPKRGHRQSSGFSLLEVLLGAILFASVFSGLAASWTYHEHSLKKFRNRNAARHLIEQEMERILAHRYNGLEDEAGTRVLTMTREIDGQAVDQAFTVESEVAENDEHTLKDITVTLSFKESNELKTLRLRNRVHRSQ